MRQEPADGYGQPGETPQVEHASAAVGEGSDGSDADPCNSATNVGKRDSGGSGKSTRRAYSISLQLQALKAPGLASLWISLAFTLSAAVFGWIGVHDLFGDTSYAVRLRASIMLAAALYSIFSAAIMFLILRRSWGNNTAEPDQLLGSTDSTLKAIVLVAAVVQCAAGITLLLYQLVSGDYTLWLWVWLAIAISGGVASAWLVDKGAKIPYPKQFAAAATLAALFAGANSAYTVFYQPEAQPVQFSVEFTLDRPAFDPTRKFASVPIKVSFVNTGRIGLHVLMSTYSVVGRRGQVMPHDRTPQDMLLATEKLQPASRRTAIAGYDILTTDRFIYEGTTFEPGDRTDAGRIVDVQLPIEYDALAVSAWVLVIRKDDVRLVDDISRVHKISWDNTGKHVEIAPDWAADPDVDFVQYLVPFDEASYLREITRQDWVGAIWRVFGHPAVGRPPGSYISLRFRPSDDEDRVSFEVAVADNRVAAERHGVTRSETGLDERSVHELGLSTPPP